MKQQSRQWFFSSVVAVGMVVFLFYLGPLQAGEWQCWDALQRWDAQRSSVASDMSFVVLDQKSLDAGEMEFGLAWPWPREAYAQVIEYMQKAGARLIFLDFLFSEPSLYGPGDDALLVEALKAQGSVYVSLITKKVGVRRETDELVALRADLILPLKGTMDSPAYRQKGVTLPLTGVLQAAAGAGSASFTPDSDGVARRVRPFWNVNGNMIPGLGLSPLVVGRYRLPDPIEVKGAWLIMGSRRLPLDMNGNIIVRYPGKWTDYPKYSMVDIIASNMALREGKTPSIPLGRFRDKIIVIGSTAEGLMDLRKTPMDSRTPGFFINAAAWVSLTTGRAYNDHAQMWVFWSIVVGLSLLGARLGSLSFSRGLLGILFAGVICTGGLLAWFWWFQSVVFILSPVLALVGSFALSTGLSYRQEQKQKQFIQGAFSQILSPKVLERLIHEPDRLNAGGEETELTIYFSDLAGFTKFSEKLKPNELVRILNRYLHEMITTIVDEQEGYVDKFIGDAVMAFWGAPVPEQDHAYRACVAALHNQARLKALQPELAQLGLGSKMHMRIGIHTGKAVVGMMGSIKKLNYTIIGDAVNLASRLEGVNKFYETSILISQETYAALNSRLIVRELDYIRVKGKQDPTRIYEVVAEPGTLTSLQERFLTAYQAGMDAYWEREFRKARNAFLHALKVVPQDFAARMFLERCDRYLKKAPGPRWDGVTTLKSK